MKLLLTGSSGFIGQHLSPSLNKNFDLHHLKSDLLDHKAVNEEVDSIQPEIIVHLAARTEVEKSFYEQITFSEINYVGTVNLIEAASKLKNLKNFVFASTMEVYGWQPISDDVERDIIPINHIAFDENTPPNPNAPYTVAKNTLNMLTDVTDFLSRHLDRPTVTEGKTMTSSLLNRLLRRC